MYFLRQYGMLSLPSLLRELQPLTAKFLKLKMQNIVTGFSLKISVSFKVYVLSNWVRKNKFQLVILNPQSCLHYVATKQLNNSCSLFVHNKFWTKGHMVTHSGHLLELSFFSLPPINTLLSQLTPFCLWLHSSTLWGKMRSDLCSLCGTISPVISGFSLRDSLPSALPTMT